MTSIIFAIPGKPVAWQRSGFSAKGGRAIIYTKEKSRAYQSLVREAAQEAWKTGPSESPFILLLTIWVKRPKDHYRKGILRADAPTYCLRKPDLDNVEKQIGDALNGVVWHDDSQIVRNSSSRNWADFDSVRVSFQELQ